MLISEYVQFVKESEQIKKRKTGICEEVVYKLDDRMLNII